MDNTPCEEQGADPPGDGRIRILLVDDDEEGFIHARELLGVLPENRIDLEWIADVEQALEQIREDRYDLYLIDYHLGPRNGLELMRSAFEGGCKAPMILMTGAGERALDFEAMQAGAADYLEKGSLDAALLERSIRYTLHEKRYAAELERKVRERTADLAEANAALREADRHKDAFLATLAHELRNPLTPIRNAIEIIRRSPDRPGVVEKSRAMIERQVNQLVRLVDDLLDISRLSRGTIPVYKERVALAEVVESALESSRPLIERQGHGLTVSLPPGPVILDADPTRLAQVLLNLLNNAAKYTEPGGSIHLEATIEAGRVVIRVRDNGPGISAELLPHLFDMFIQEPRNQENAQRGLGIGLSLVKSLVELHGGKVAARSDGPGQGSEFTIELPLPLPLPE